MDKYHIALSFAGEDREYVERVARVLRDCGVQVFYDRFEETKLWGKDLYTYLRDIYQNRAIYTVLFVSEAYKGKLWTNHERESAQARAFTEHKEYILPAKFDESVGIPGITATTGYIALSSLSPEEFAEKIIKKLEDDGVIFSVEDAFAYSDEAKADIDFPLLPNNPVTSIITDLKSYNWYTQSPAIEKIYDLAWESVSPDEMFVIGRNIYQCACGGEHSAEGILNNLRRELARFPIDVAEHLLNGIFYEMYFNSKGEFRGCSLKSRYINELFALQTIEKFKKSILFIRKALEPYREYLPVIPNKSPENIELEIDIKTGDPAQLASIIYKGKQLIVDAQSEEYAHSRMWVLSFSEFTISKLKEHISKECHIPSEQLFLIRDGGYPDKLHLRLPEEKTIQCPSGCKING